MTTQSPPASILIASAINKYCSCEGVLYFVSTAQDYVGCYRDDPNSRVMSPFGKLGSTFSIEHVIHLCVFYCRMNVSFCHIIFKNFNLLATVSGITPSMALSNSLLHFISFSCSASHMMINSEPGDPTNVYHSIIIKH